MLIPLVVFTASAFTPPEEDVQITDEGTVEDIFAPQPTAPGDRATVRALVRNTGAQPWSDGTQVRFWMQDGDEVVWERYTSVSGEPVGRAVWAEKSFTLPEKMGPGKFRLRAEIVNGDKLIAESPKPVIVLADPYAFSDGFEREDVESSRWDFARAGKGNKIGTTSSLAYSRGRSLMLNLKGGGDAYLQYEFHNGGTDRLSISMRLRVNQKTLNSGGPINFCAVFGKDQFVSVYFYYYTDKKWFQIDYQNPDGTWNYHSISHFHLRPDIWYNLKATVALGAKGFLALDVDGLEVLHKKTDLPYGSITNLTIGHHPKDKRLRGKIYFDDVRWAREGIDSFGRGRVSLTFDDGAVSQWTKAKPLLDKYGYKASFYVITDDSEYPAYSQTGIVYAMDRYQLLSLQQQGHFVGSHTHNHRRLAHLTGPEVDQELILSKEMLESWGIDAQTLSLPYGSYNDDVIRRAQRIYRLCLTTSEGINPYDAIIAGRLIMRVDATNKPFSEVKELIKETARTGGWLVFYYHAIGPSQGGDHYWTPAGTLENTLIYLKKKGLKVLPIELAP